MFAFACNMARWRGSVYQLIGSDPHISVKVFPACHIKLAWMTVKQWLSSTRVTVQETELGNRWETLRAGV